MSETNNGTASNESSEEKEVAKKVALLNDQQRQRYEARVNQQVDWNGAVTQQFRLDVANTLLQSIPAHEQDRQIGEHQRRETQRASLNDQRIAREQAAPAKQPISEPATRVQDSGNRQPIPGNPMEGVRLHDPTRDYSKLQKTHEQVAATQKQNADLAVAAESATTLLSKEQLQNMAERYAELRKAGNIQPTPSELRERNDLTKMQAADREKLDRNHGPIPNEQQQQQRALLDHQHLAEQVGVEAKWIGQHLRKQAVPGAESFEREARTAHHTARQVHEQRQNFGAGMDRSQVAARVVQQQDQQKRTLEQEALIGGKTLTAEQRANVSADVKQATDRNERTVAAAREATGPTGDRSGQRGNSRPTGRSR